MAFTAPKKDIVSGGFVAPSADKKTEKGFMRRAAESVIDSPALPIVGSVVGAGLSAPTGPGAIGGAALGGAAGESFRQLGARALGMNAPQTSLDAAKGIGIEGAVQGAGEAVGLGAGKFIVKPLAKLAKGPLEDLFQIITKIKPEDAAILFKNPKAILPGQMAKAKEAWKVAAKAAGIDVDEVSPALLNALKTDAKKTVFDTFERVQAGDAITAGQAQLAKQALDIGLMPAAKTERNKPLIAILTKMRQSFADVLGEESPALAKANKQYGVAKAGSKFQSFFPRNLDNSPAYFRSSVLPSILLGLGAGRGEPGEGALQAGIASAATSPLAIGSLIALAGGVNPAMPLLRRTITSSLANLAGDTLRKRK